MYSMCQLIAWMPGPMELIVIGIFGLLIFGKRLPEVGKSLGRSIVEFKKGLNGIEDDVQGSLNRSQSADMLPPPRTTDTPAEARPEQSQSVPHNAAHTD